MTLKQIETLLARGDQAQLCIYVREPLFPRRTSRFYITPFFYNYYPPPCPPVLVNKGITGAVLAALPRATILDTVAHKSSGTSVIVPPHVISVESLSMPMPVLTSLRRSDQYHPCHPRWASNLHRPQPALFAGVTPSLRHLAVLDTTLEWSDPIYKNLTYLHIRRPSTRCTFDPPSARHTLGMSRFNISWA